MSEPLRIKSARDAFWLELGPPESRAREGWFPVALGGGPITAVVRAYDLEVQRIATFFESMASESHGWPGEKSFQSLEGHLTLSATMDRLGHVYLQVVLTDCDDPARWRTQTTIVLEAGQLDAIAKAAKRVFHASAAV